MKNINSNCWKNLPFELVQHVMLFQRKKMPLKLIIDIQLYPLLSKLEKTCEITKCALLRIKIQALLFHLNK